jgi:hypothetical protein
MLFPAPRELNIQGTFRADLGNIQSPFRELSTFGKHSEPIREHPVPIQGTLNIQGTSWAHSGNIKSKLFVWIT